MSIVGVLIGMAIVVGLVLLMGKLSTMGVEINDQFCRGDCSSCGKEPGSEQECGQFRDLSAEWNLREKESSEAMRPVGSDPSHQEAIRDEIFERNMNEGGKNESESDSKQ